MTEGTEAPKADGSDGPLHPTDQQSAVQERDGDPRNNLDNLADSTISPPTDAADVEERHSFLEASISGLAQAEQQLKESVTQLREKELQAKRSLREVEHEIEQRRLESHNDRQDPSEIDQLNRQFREFFDLSAEYRIAFRHGTDSNSISRGIEDLQKAAQRFAVYEQARLEGISVLSAQPTTDHVRGLMERTEQLLEITSTTWPEDARTQLIESFEDHRARLISCILVYLAGWHTKQRNRWSEITDAERQFWTEVQVFVAKHVTSWSEALTCKGTFGQEPKRTFGHKLKKSLAGPFGCSFVKVIHQFGGDDADYVAAFVTAALERVGRLADEIDERQARKEDASAPLKMLCCFFMESMLPFAEQLGEFCCHSPKGAAREPFVLKYIEPVVKGVLLRLMRSATPRTVGLLNLVTALALALRLGKDAGEAVQLWLTKKTRDSLLAALDALRKKFGTHPVFLSKMESLRPAIDGNARGVYRFRFPTDLPKQEHCSARLVLADDNDRIAKCRLIDLGRDLSGIGLVVVEPKAEVGTDALTLKFPQRAGGHVSLGRDEIAQLWLPFVDAGEEFYLRVEIKFRDFVVVDHSARICAEVTRVIPLPTDQEFGYKEADLSKQVSAFVEYVRERFGFVLKPSGHLVPSMPALGNPP